MRFQTALLPADDIARSPAFTLGTALMWLGHDCSGLCPAVATGCHAGVWFFHLPEPNATWTRTLVDVDFRRRSWLDDERRSVLRRINRCIQPDRLRVRERTPVERATFLSALAVRQGGS